MHVSLSSSEVLDFAREVMSVESEGILHVAEKIDGSFFKAVQMILHCKGKLILAGVGKSGLVMQKLAATFSSTGTPSFFLHPTEGAHGDFGGITRDDLVMIASYGGESSELHELIKYVRRVNIEVIAICGNQNSILGKACAVVLDIKVPKEACPLGLAPTTSTAATMALGDALAMCVLRQRGFKIEDFAMFHPGGALGARLLTRIKDVMHSGDSIPLVYEGAPLKEVLKVMTRKEVRGVAGVINLDQSLIGVITDGDIRRYLEKADDIVGVFAKDLMSKEPKQIADFELAERAMVTMRDHSIQSLFVIDGSGSNVPVGIVHIQDLIKAKIC